jgi:hypothetical protein
MGAHNALTIEGLDELRAALRRLPEELAAEAGGIVLTAATDAASAMDAQYAAHEWTGNLRRGLSVTREEATQRYGARAVVKNRAPHAWWAENGTQIRRTSKGVNRGAMPPIHVFVPTAIKYRRAMVEQLKALVRRAGLVVSDTEIG